MSEKDRIRAKNYYHRNKERCKITQRAYYENNREVILAKRRKRWVHKEREGLYIYLVYPNGKIEEHRGKDKTADKLFISNRTIDYAIKKKNGYCRLLDCHIVKSWNKLSDNDVLNKLKNQRKVHDEVAV